jgi:enolase
MAKALTRALGQRTKLVGDDVFGPIRRSCARGIATGVGQRAARELNQIGTVSENVSRDRDGSGSQVRHGHLASVG